MTNKNAVKQDDKPETKNYPKRFDLAVEGRDPLKINMTFGLLTEISKDFQTLEDFQVALIDQDRVLDLIDKAIMIRDDEGDPLPEGQPSIRKLDIDVEEFERVSEWLLGHVLSFFARRMKAFTSATEGSQSQLGEMVLRLNKLKIG